MKKFTEKSWETSAPKPEFVIFSEEGGMMSTSLIYAEEATKYFH